MKKIQHKMEEVVKTDDSCEYPQEACRLGQH